MNVYVLPVLWQYFFFLSFLVFFFFLWLAHIGFLKKKHFAFLICKIELNNSSFVKSIFGMEYQYQNFLFLFLICALEYACYRNLPNLHIANLHNFCKTLQYLTNGLHIK